jgi:hypothetical protein
MSRGVSHLIPLHRVLQQLEKSFSLEKSGVH